MIESRIMGKIETIQDLFDTEEDERSNHQVQIRGQVMSDIDNDKEKVIQRTIALLMKFFVLCLDIPQEDKLDDHGGHDDVDYHLVSDGGNLHPHLCTWGLFSQST